MKLLDPAARHITGTEGDIADLVGIAEYVAAAVAQEAIPARAAQQAVREWGAEPHTLLRAAHLTSNEAAARLLRSCATQCQRPWSEAS